MSSDPWFDWLIDFGTLDGFSPIPPEFRAIDPVAGTNVNGWMDDDGNIHPVLDPLPPLPPNAPACAHSFYASLSAALGGAWAYARQYCFTCQLRLLMNPFSNWQAPLTYVGFLIACGSEQGANWGDPCAGGGVAVPPDCDYLTSFFSGYFRKNCPERELSLGFSPAVHRLVSEVLSPTGRAFMWRLAYDQPVLWPLVFNPEILRENNACKSYALGLLLQIEALQDLLNQVTTETCFIQFREYFDGILTGRQYSVVDANGAEVGSGFIGYNKTLALAMCLGESIFRQDIGRVACDEDGEDDMGCDCDKIREIVREELAIIRDDYLDPTRENTRWLRELWEPIESVVTEFFGTDGENAWTRFLSRFSLLSGYLRPSDTDPDTVITPTLTDRLDEGFRNTKRRQRVIFGWVKGVLRVVVLVKVNGERVSSRDTYIPPSSKRGYNHYGQVWLRYTTGGVERLSAWQWIRAREQEMVFLIPDLRLSESDTIQIQAEYQLFAGLSMSDGYPRTHYSIPEMTEASLWMENGS